MEIISSRDFRSQMSEYLRKALETDIIIKSQDFGSFKLVPISEDDTLMSKEAFFAKIDKALQNIEAGNFVEVRTREELHNLLENL